MTKRETIVGLLEKSIAKKDAELCAYFLDTLIFLDARTNEPRGISHARLSAETLISLALVLPARSPWFDSICDALEAA